jgi:hypothetical protein
MTARRVLIVGADGLRPDAVRGDVMPTYERLKQAGTHFPAFISAFPTHTRVNMSTLTTGTLPGKHGLVNNVLYVHSHGGGRLVDTADAAGLRSFEADHGSPALLVPTLGDRLRAHDERLAVAASSTPGASLLWNLNRPNHVLNPASAYGQPDLMVLLDKLGPVPREHGRTKYESCRWATRALIDTMLDDPRNRVLTLWLTEPDASQHFYGVGSAEHLEALRVVDECVAELVSAVELRGSVDEFDLLTISDHGHSSVAHARSLSEHLERAREELSLADRFVAVGDWVYLRDTAGGEGTIFDDAARLVAWCQDQPWCDLVLVAADELAGLTGTFRLDTATGPILHDRAPVFCVSPTWSSNANEFGAPGIVSSLTSYAPLRSTHGTASPFDLRAYCVGYGPSFAAGQRRDDVVSTTDIAPTVMNILGYGADATTTADAGFDGRSLLAEPEPQQVDRTETTFPNGRRSAILHAATPTRDIFLGSALEDEAVRLAPR